MIYNRLIIEERPCIYQFLNLGMSIRQKEIARYKAKEKNMM